MKRYLCIPVLGIFGLLGTSVLPAIANEKLNDLTQFASCLIAESEVVVLTSSVPGILDIMDLEEGDRVQKGQVIASLQTEVERAALNATKARAESDVILRSRERQLSAASKLLARQVKLFKRKVVAQSQVDEAQTEVDLAQLAMEEAEFERRIASLELKRVQAEVDRRIIKSPINGIVTKIDRSVGEYIDPAVGVLTIAQVDPLEIEVYLPLDAYPLVKVGDDAIISPQAPINGEYALKIATKSPLVDAASGLFRLTLLLPNTANRVPAGVRCSVKFQ